MPNASSRAQRIDADIIFLCRKQKGNLIELLEKEFRVIALPEKKLLNCKDLKGRELYESWLGCSEADDADDCLRALDKAEILKADWIVVDHYGLSAKWEADDKCTKNKNATKMMAIDDLADRHHEADILLDQNYFGNNTDERYQGLG